MNLDIKNHDIKLVAVDMDGTLLDSEKNIPVDFVPWVQTHPEIQTVIASGRQYYKLKEMFPEIAERLMYVAENGSFVFRQDKMIYSNTMTREDVRWCIDTFDSVEGCHLVLCGEKSAYMKHASKYVEDNGHMYYARLAFVDSLYDSIDKDNFAKVALFEEHAGAEKMFRELPSMPSHLAPVLSGNSWIDFANVSVSKGAAMEAIQKALDIDKNECMAFGDYMNDYDLLMSCEESYAMKNGHPKLKDAAKYVTEYTNDEDGVMRILRELE
ncbi:MAG: HAD family hydrolase [Clostridiales bacterium]|nr:HAD family hydrolase [Clostridiales bacterium]